MENTVTIGSKTVGEVVAENYKSADVFGKYGIDFCCGGNITLSEVCKKHDLDLEKLKMELMEIDPTTPGGQEFNHWKLDFLMDYIINVHHAYVIHSIPVIKEYLQSVVAAHGKYHSEVLEFQRLFDILAEELLQHIAKEENIIFPMIKQPDWNEIEDEFMGSVHPSARPISVMEMEHVSTGYLLKSISRVTNEYTPPSDACNTFIVLYKKMKEFETDLHKHIHLENNILFPKALEMKGELHLS